MLKSFKKDKIKYKLLSFEELCINIDRLSRFKLPEESFSRVFNSVLYKYLIYPKYSKTQLENLAPEIVSGYVKQIWNSSVVSLFKSDKNNPELNKVFKLLISTVFKNIDERTKCYINTNLLISPIIEHNNYSSAPLNLKLLIKANEYFNDGNPVNKDSLFEFSKKYSLKFPVRKLVIVEGITEEILLPVFANKIGLDFNQNGVFVLGAGGKSKSPDVYIKLRDKLKIPVILLFDSDATEICNFLNKSLLKKDKTIIIKEGEFEDILSLNLIKRTLNSEYETIMPISVPELKLHNRMCANIEEYYRTRKLGEFKKSKFSKMLAENIKYNTDVSEEIKNIIKEII